MLTLSGYDNTNGDAFRIFTNDTSTISVSNTESVDITSYLISNNILAAGHADWVDYHGFVTNVGNSVAIYVSETLILMSEVKNAGETPLLFARIENSSNGVPLTPSDVSSVVYTIYKYDQAAARSGGSGKTAITGWSNKSVDVADCFLNDPVDDDPRANFAYNFKFEPNTLTNNPFTNPGRYTIEFTITPTNGNRVPVVFNIALT